MVTEISRKKQKARKEHICDWCGEKIHKGDIYDNSKNVYEGTIFTWKAHNECLELTHELSMFDNCDNGLSSDGFLEYLNEGYSSIMSEMYNELYESEDFVIPNTTECIKFVLENIDEYNKICKEKYKQL